MYRWRKAAVFVFVLVLAFSGYAAGLTLQEAKTLASGSQSGDVLLQWSPDNPWPGSVVSRSDGTTVWMETNFWNINSGDGENYMRFIASEDKVAFYVNMTNVQTKYGGNAWATPNVIFVGRTPKAWWGDKEPVGGYENFALPMNGSDVMNYSEVWAKIDYELAKSEETLVRAGIIMWFETLSGGPLGEVYIPFFDDYGGIVGTQYPPVDIANFTATIYVDGTPVEVNFTLQRAWNWDHFVLEFVPSQPISGKEVIMNLQPFAAAAIQGIVDDQYSDWTPDQITWTSAGFGTYTGSNGNAFELGWVLNDARIISSSELPGQGLTGLELMRAIASTKEDGDIQFTWWDQWLEQPIERSDGTPVWMQTNFWNIVGGDGEVFMRYIKATDEFAFYVNLKNIQTQWGGIAWATPEVIFAGRAPKQWWGDKPPVGGYEDFNLPMPASEISKYEHIWVKAKYEVAKADNALVRFGINLWVEDVSGAPIGELYIPFIDDFGGIVGDRKEIGTITAPVIINGEEKTMTFTVQRALSGGGWGVLLFLPEEQFPTSAEVVIDVVPMMNKVVEQMSDFFGMPVDQQVWCSMSLGSYSGGEDPAAGFEYGWIIHDVRVSSVELASTTTTETSTQTETTTTTTTTTTTSTTTTSTTTSPSTTTTTTTTTTTSPPSKTTTTTTSKEGGGGICGPAALVGLVIVPLLLRRRK